MVRLKADPNVDGVSYGGQEYPLVKGYVQVPEETAKELLSFGWGFTLAVQRSRMMRRSRSPRRRKAKVKGKKAK